MFLSFLSTHDQHVGWQFILISHLINQPTILSLIFHYPNLYIIGMCTNALYWHVRLHFVFQCTIFLSQYKLIPFHFFEILFHILLFIGNLLTILLLPSIQMNIFAFPREPKLVSTCPLEVRMRRNVYWQSGARNLRFWHILDEAKLCCLIFILGSHGGQDISNVPSMVTVQI